MSPERFSAWHLEEITQIHTAGSYATGIGQQVHMTLYTRGMFEDQDFYG